MEIGIQFTITCRLLASLQVSVILALFKDLNHIYTYLHIKRYLYTEFLCCFTLPVIKFNNFTYVSCSKGQLFSLSSSGPWLQQNKLFSSKRVVLSLISSRQSQYFRDACVM